MNNKLLIRPKPRPHAKIRLFCFPYAGGSCSVFTPWLTLIDPQIELVLVQLPGRGARILDVPHQIMEEVCNELMEHYEFITSKPFAFFGHSLGSRVGYELAAQLHLSGFSAPLVIFASASRAPHLQSAKAPICNLSDDEFIKELRDLNGTPKEVLENRELMEFLLPVLKADFNIAERHIAAPVILPTPIHVFQGTNDDIPDTQINAWQELTNKSFYLSKFQGGHFFIHQSSSKMVEIINTNLLELSLTK